MVVFERSDPRRYYNQADGAATPLVLFDRAGVVRPVPLDQAELPPPWPRLWPASGAVGVHLPLVAMRSAGATPWPPSAA